MAATVLWFLTFAAAGWAADWTTVAGNAARTGYVPDGPKPPFRYKWAKYTGEMLSNSVQPIVAEGKLFIGTWHSHMLALGENAGEQVWRFEAGGPIIHTALYDRGTVYFCCMDGHLYALDVGNGALKWKFAADPFLNVYGIWASPLLVDGVIYFGSQNGCMYAVDAAAGKQVWKFDAKAPILQTAASAFGKIYFGSEDMTFWALDAKTGAEVWRQRLWGQSFHYYWPTVSEEAKVVLTTKMSVFPHGGMKVRPVDPNAQDPIASRRPVPVIDEGLYALDAETGEKRPIKAPIGIVSGDCTINSPCVITGAEAWINGCRIDLKTGVGDKVFGNPDVVVNGRPWNAQGPKWVEETMNKEGRFLDYFNMVWDESVSFSGAGEFLFGVHGGSAGAFDVREGKHVPFECVKGLNIDLRMLFGNENGAFTPWGNDMAGPARSPAAIAEKRLYWIAANYVRCVEGN